MNAYSVVLELLQIPYDKVIETEYIFRKNKKVKLRLFEMLRNLSIIWDTLELENRAYLSATILIYSL